MYLIAAIKMAVCLVEIIDDNVSQNHCVSNCSLTKTVASSNLSQHILTRIVVTSTGRIGNQIISKMHDRVRLAKFGISMR